MAEKELTVHLEDEAGWMIIRPAITILLEEKPYPKSIGIALSHERELQLEHGTPYVDHIRKGESAIYTVRWITGLTPMPLIKTPVRERPVPDFVPPNRK